MPPSGRGPRWRDSSITRAASTSFPARLTSTIRPADFWRAFTPRNLAQTAPSRQSRHDAHARRRGRAAHLRSRTCARFFSASPPTTARRLTSPRPPSTSFPTSRPNSAPGMCAAAWRKSRRSWPRWPGAHGVTFRYEHDRDRLERNRSRALTTARAAAPISWFATATCSTARSRLSLAGLSGAQARKRTSRARPFHLRLHSFSRRARMRSAPRPSQHFLLGRLSARVRRNSRARKSVPREPTIYISDQRAHRSRPRAGRSRQLFHPGQRARARSQAAVDGRQETRGYRDLVLARLARFGFDDLPARIVAERALHPTDFAARDLAYHGALYGWASHSIRTSLFRPPLRARDAERLLRRRHDPSRRRHSRSCCSAEKWWPN